MSDEGFHEIQLNGKHLVFLFMAATVVSVVIFLCGVMVGRGVQTARSETASAQEAGLEPPRPVESAGAGAATQQALPAEPPPVESDYYDRLVDGKSREALDSGRAARDDRSAAGKPPEAPQASASKPASTPPATKTAAVPDKPVAVPDKPAATSLQKPAPAAERAPARTDTDPTSSGRYAVQLAALRERNEAEAIVRRLVAKGYQAYVLVPAPGAPPVYRVQVGRFKSRSEADRTAARLRKEEQFTPWVTR
jgi:cell division septation protein DedD